MDLMAQYVTQFAEAVRAHLPPNAPALIRTGRSQFPALPGGDKLTACLLARCPLRICIGLTADASHFPEVFGQTTLQHTAALYCLDDLLQRFRPAHAQLPPLGIPPGATSVDTILVIKWLHTVQYRAEEAQDIAFGFLPPNLFDG